MKFGLQDTGIKFSKFRENSTNCYLMINICRKTIVNPSNFNIGKQYRIVFFYLRCKLNIRMLAIKLISGNNIELFSSISDVNVILGCWQLR